MFDVDELAPEKLILLTGEKRQVQNKLNHLIAVTAQQSQATLLVANNWLNIYQLNYLVASSSNNYTKTLQERIMLKRSETVYQVCSALRQMKPSSGVFFIIGLLANFYDEGVEEREADTLLAECLSALQDSKQKVQIVVTSQPSMHRPRLWLALSKAADQIITIHPPVEINRQPRLWGL